MGIFRRLSSGRGHNLYGEAAWPNDILYVFAPAIESLLCGLLGCPLACAPPGGLPADAFSTPVEILPEWYLLASFNLLRVAPGKPAGIAAALGLLAFLAAMPFYGEALLTFFQNPWRRPSNCGSALTCIAGGGLLSAGGIEVTDCAAPSL